MRTIIRKFRNLFLNVLTSIVCMFVHRDDSIWLFGAWMGQRFADNSRFLFQYLHKHKEEYNISKLIWVTDNTTLLPLLRDMGYEAYEKYSAKGIFWHFRSGVHVVSNYCATMGFHYGDIIGELSAGAIKLQLWHGVGIKATGLLRVNYIKDNNTLKDKIRKKILYNKHFLGHKMFSPGCWAGRKQLATSIENKRVAVLDGGLDDSQVFIANYPRLAYVGELLDNERKIIEKLSVMSKGKKVVLYCPTFRERPLFGSSYINPIEVSEFRDFLKEQNLLWVEKRHAVSTDSLSQPNTDEVFYIESEFDINLIYDYIDVLVTDYSSASSDCLYKGKKVLSFIPDYAEYIDKERGFVSQYELYYPGIITKNIDELKKGMIESLSEKYFSDERKRRYSKCKTFLYDNNPADMKWIINKIKIALYAK